MTHSDATPARKTSRLGLYIPWGAAILLVVGWSFWWLWLRFEAEHRIDLAVASFRAQGGQLTWAARRIGGYPFRLDIDFDNFRVADPSGWGLATSSLRTEAYAFAPDNWILATANGATLSMPGAAPLHIASPVMRASLNSWDQHPPRFSFVGEDLTFARDPGAPVFPLAGANAVQIYTRAAPDDQGAVLAQVDGGAAAPASNLAALAGGKPVSVTVDALFSHGSMLQSGPWRSAAADWANKGGAISVQHIAFSTGAVTLESHAGSFRLDAGGALSGEAPATLALSGAASPVTLDLHDGGMWLGTKRLGPAPRAF